MDEKIYARFMAKVDIPEDVDDCWPWLGARTSDGYGHIAINGKSVYVHRLSHEHFIGPV
jgi:hypothetical protein